MKSWLILLYGLLLGLLVTGAILLIAQPKLGSAIELSPAATHTPTLPPAPSKTPQPITVQMGGQVFRPGVYSLPPGSRVQDLLLMAGGFTSDADESRINRALLIRDGDYIYIPTIQEQFPETASNAPENVSQVPAFTYPLDLNEACLEALDSLPGIGPGKAADILTYREEHGDFNSVEELVNVPGIGEATLDSIRDLLRVEP